MNYDGFTITTRERIRDAHCTHKGCKNKPELMEVSNGFVSVALFCPDCKSVYVLKIERVKKVSKEFMEQCLDELEHEKRKRILIGELVLEKEHRNELQREARMKKDDERIARLKARKKKK